jgi:1-acyl-sn-glycerol-3-phosphate acyltransferase
MSAQGTGAEGLVSEPMFYSACRVFCRVYTTVNHDLKVYGVHHVPQRGGVIIASTHQSNLDPVLIGVRLRRALSFLAKSELFENPSFGWLIRNLNAFPVRQGEGDIGAVKQTIRRLQEGHALNIYPEGTRSRDGEMQPLEPGIGLIVRRAGVPVVPAVVDGSFDAMPPGSWKIRPAPVRVMFGPAMNLSDLKAAAVVQKLEATLRTMLDELRQRDPVLQQAREARRRRHAR